MSIGRTLPVVGLACTLALLPAGSTSGAQGSIIGKALWKPGGVPISVAPDFQSAQHVTTDGEQGLIIVWADRRSPSTGWDIYAQRVSAEGEVLWRQDGIPVVTMEGNQLGPRIAGDDAGGALVAWSDFRGQTDYDIFAQRLDGDGNHLWATDGITVAAGINDQYVVDLVPDGVGGAFVVWEDWPGFEDEDWDANYFAQRIDGAGNLSWSAPVTVTAAPGWQYMAEAVPDGEGGLLVTWGDARDPDNAEIYAQHISADGEVLWEPDGVLAMAYPDPALQRPGPIVSDGAGGAYVAWYDFRANHNLADAYLQRLSADGSPAWAADLPVVADPARPEGPDALVPDGGGGVIVFASSSEEDILAQHVDRAGEFVWGAEPVNVTPWGEQQTWPAAVPDGQGGAYVAWIDKYTDPALYDIWAQHVTADGALLWPGHGALVNGAASAQDVPVAVADGGGGFIIAWQDWPGGPEETDLYAQHVVDVRLEPRCFLPLVHK